MEFEFEISTETTFSFDELNEMSFEISMPEKEYIEKELATRSISFSFSALFANVVTAFCRTEEEEENLIHGN